MGVKVVVKEGLIVEVIVVVIGAVGLPVLVIAVPLEPFGGPIGIDVDNVVTVVYVNCLLVDVFVTVSSIVVYEVL